MSIGKRKSVQAILVLLITTAIILAGAFAWYSFTQSALNIFEGWTNPDVNLHDDFDEPNKDVYVENSGQRPLYVRVKFDEYMEIDGKSIMSLDTAMRGNIDTWIEHMYKGTSGPEFCVEEIHEYYDWIMGNAPGDPNTGWKYYLSAPFENRALFDEFGMQLRNPTAVEFKDDEQFYGIPNPDYDPAATTGTPESEEYIWVTLEEAYAYIDGTLAADLTVTPSFITPTFVTAASGGTPVGPFTVTATTTNKDYLTWLYKVIDVDVAAIGHAANKTQAEADKAAAQLALTKFLADAELGYQQIAYDVVSKAELTGNENDKYTLMEPENTYKNHLLTNPDPVPTLTEYLVAQGYLENPTMEFVPLARTKATAKVYTMAQWIAAGMPTGNFWVMDDDGWCYWADVLLPGQTTGLLLSEVIQDKLNPPNGVWWYGINVSLQAVTAEDIAKLGIESGPATEVGGGYTENGEMLLDAVSGKYVFGVDKITGTVDTTGDGSGDGAALKPNADIITYEKFKDNTYRLRSPNGEAETYAPLFIYTGNTGSNVAAMMGLYDVFHPGDPTYTDFEDNSEYKVTTEFWKLAEVNPETWVKFKVVDAGQGTYPSGVMQSSFDSKRYVKLEYTDKSAQTQTAWLSVGVNSVFDALTTTAPTGLAGTPGYAAGNKVSQNDDMLIWTAEDEPGKDDRYSEEIPKNSLKVGDVIEVDSIEWLVLGKDVGGTNDGKTLIISKDVLEQVANDSTNIADALAAYNTSGGKVLTKLVATTGTPTTVLLTANEAIDYFASNATRAAAGGKWWLAKNDTERDEVGGSVVSVSGGFEAYDPSDTTTAIGLRPAMWVDSDDLYAIVYPAS